jgi:hypothetical protein
MAFGRRMIGTVTAASAIGASKQPGRRSWGFARAVAMAGIAFVLSGTLLILGLPILGMHEQLGGEGVVSVLALLVFAASPSATAVYAVVLGIADLAFRALRIRGVTPYAVVGAAAPLAACLSIGAAAGRDVGIIWYPLLLVPAGLVGGLVLGLHRSPG